MDSKVLISLVSVALGWLLAQATALAKDWWTRRKLVNGLITELEDIQSQLQRVVMIHARHLQMFAAKCMDPAASLPIQNLFFKQYFKDALLSLTREQRISYQLIHASLDGLNKKNDELAKFVTDALEELHRKPDDNNKLAIINVWGDRVIALYETAREIQWHIEYHLNHKKTPTFDIMGAMHASYVSFQQELEVEVRTILEKARGFKPSDFGAKASADTIRTNNVRASTE